MLTRLYIMTALMMAPTDDNPSGGGGGGDPVAPPTPPAAPPAAPPATPPVQAAPKAAEPAAPPAEPQRQRPVISRKAERDKGRNSLQAELEAEAKKLGFKSHADLMAAAAEAKRKPAAAAPAEPAAAAPAAPSNDEGLTKAELRRKRLAKKLLRTKKQLAKQREANETRAAEFEVREAAIRAGVQDVDYALQLFRRHIAKMTKAELSAFDEHAWFATDLRKSHPYLYGTVTRPADTGPGAKDAPPPSAVTPPAAPAVTVKGADDGQIDARKMSRKEYTDYLRSKGLTLPDAGTPM